MDRRYLIDLSVFIVIMIIATSFMLQPKIKEANIKKEIEKANYCQVDSDCVDAGGKCPFGCYNYVNKNEGIRIAQLIETFDSKCVYGCIDCQTAICKDNKCKEICE